MATGDSEPLEFEILDDIVPPETRGRSQIDNSELIERYKEGRASGKYSSIYHATEDLSQYFKGVSRATLAQRLYRERKAGNID